MAIGAVICGLISGLFCLGGLVIYLIWIGILAKVLPKGRRRHHEDPEGFDGEFIEAEFKEK